jgi:CubicO group peptidase (beta-lactamase class C family)
VRVAGYKGTADMSEAHGRLLSALTAAGRPVILVSFGSPYLLRQAPDVAAYVCAYGGAESSQRAAVAALFGEYPVTGRLPVTIPGYAAFGDGLQIPMRPLTLRAAAPESVGFRPDGLAEVDRVIEDAVRRKVFPGAVVAIGRDGTLAHLKAFGTLTYDAGAPEVRTDTIYDLASLTKVMATTTMAMILADERKLDITKPVSAYVPEYSGGLRDKVTVWHLLTHSGGVDWPGGGPGRAAPLYKELKGQDAYIAKIATLDPIFEPGTKVQYTDLGPILLGEVLERVAGKSLDAFARERIFGPLGMKDTAFRPDASLRARIAPTEVVDWRGGLLRGEVHDENAWALGGVAPHAGLFGTAPDAARFAQMMLNGGVLEHHRFFSRETLERFVTRAGVGESSRALGWDTPSPSSSAGSLSPRSFGHTGFTGTSMWIDPERKMFVILLSNRVHPSRGENAAAITRVRREVADAAARALQTP